MIAFLIDADNFSSPAWIDEAFQTLERTEGSISIRRAYGSAENLKGLADTLRFWAVRPFVNLPLPKNTTDMSLAVDAMELACMAPRPKLVVIGSGDLDFVPLVVRLRERGIKVVCVTERSKMAQDAVPAYDQVIYVGGDQVDRSKAVEPNKLLKYCFERGNSQFFRVPYPLVTSEKSLVGRSMRAFFSNRGRPRGISAAC